MQIKLCKKCCRCDINQSINHILFCHKIKTVIHDSYYYIRSTFNSCATAKYNGYLPFHAAVCTNLSRCNATIYLKWAIACRLQLQFSPKECLPFRCNHKSYAITFNVMPLKSKFQEKENAISNLVRDTEFYDAIYQGHFFVLKKFCKVPNCFQF